MRVFMAMVGALLIGAPSRASAQEQAPPPPETPPAQVTPSPETPQQQVPLPDAPVPVEPPPARPQPQAFNTLGNRCTARADCSDGLRCLENVCVDEAAFFAARPRHFRDTTPDDATRGYFGGRLGGVLPAYWGGLGEGFEAALRLGVLVGGHVQFQLEVSPGSTVLANVASFPVGMFDAVGSVGYLAPMTRSVSWIVRAGGGGGFGFGNTEYPGAAIASSGVVPFGEVRVEIIGVAVRTSKHLQVELNLPSFRVLVVPSVGAPQASFLLVTSVAFNYMF